MFGQGDAGFSALHGNESSDSKSVLRRMKNKEWGIENNMKNTYILGKKKSKKKENKNIGNNLFF